MHPGIIKTDMSSWMGNENLPPVREGVKSAMMAIKKPFKVNKLEQGGYFDDDGSLLKLEGDLGRKY